MTIKAVIFDVDGTIADTLDICIESYREVLQRYTYRPYQTEEITRHFGLSEEGILAAYIPAASLPEAYEDYIRVYEERHAGCREPFPGGNRLG